MADGFDGKPATRSLAMLQHGGRLNQAARKYAIEADAWLDLSTVIRGYIQAANCIVLTISSAGQ
ncbi:MAG: hypothetical protein QNL62_24835 [Gammaproteobacteria bacterium]|nr:hypothetical protein [Gammaproteobacteria bacterium]